MIKVNAYLHTDGTGLWSDVARKVHVTGLVCRPNGSATWGELRVYFDVGTWNVDQDGLIYTDRLWLEQLRHMLVEIGLSADVEYSEQGMQGSNYVSLDCDEEFVGHYLNFEAAPHE